MVSVRAALFLLLSSVILLGAERTTVQFSISGEHSPSVSRFYRDILDNLRFEQYRTLTTQKNETLLHRNTSFTPQISLAFSYHGSDKGVYKFTPLSVTTFGYKRLKSQEVSSLVFDFVDMRMFRLLTGFAPEFSFRKQRYSSIVVRPVFQSGAGMTVGTLDLSAFLLFRTGVTVSWEALQDDLPGKRKGKSLGFGIHYEQVPEFVDSDVEYGKDYAEAIRKRAVYPHHSLHFSLSFTWIMRSTSPEAQR